jgi:hypothetical protein
VVVSLLHRANIVPIHPRLNWGEYRTQTDLRFTIYTIADFDERRDLAQRASIVNRQS